jgi:hypothetical protein
MQRGRITLPRPNRDELVEIRRGKYSLEEIRELGAQLESEALAAQATSPLPDEVDRDPISGLLAEVHLRFWRAYPRYRPLDVFSEKLELIVRLYR